MRRKQLYHIDLIFQGINFPRQVNGSNKMQQRTNMSFYQSVRSNNNMILASLYGNILLNNKHYQSESTQLCKRSKCHFLTVLLQRLNRNCYGVPNTLIIRTIFSVNCRLLVLQGKVMRMVILHKVITC